MGVGRKLQLTTVSGEENVNIMRNNIINSFSSQLIWCILLVPFLEMVKLPHLPGYPSPNGI